MGVFFSKYEALSRRVELFCSARWRVVLQALQGQQQWPWFWQFASGAVAVCI